jgi:hypothetical protein
MRGTSQVRLVINPRKGPSAIREDQSESYPPRRAAIKFVKDPEDDASQLNRLLRYLML